MNKNNHNNNHNRLLNKILNKIILTTQQPQLMFPTTTFLETQFPTSISYGARGGACFSTDITTSFSGYEQRNINWNRSRAKYNISLSNKTKEEIKEVINFFYNVYGKAIGFRFKDWLDYKSDPNELIANCNGTQRIFPLIKTYSIFNTNKTYTKLITKPVKTTVQLYLDNLEQFEDETYTLDYTTGLITFDTIPSSGSILTANFEFDIPVRFDTDELIISSDDLNCNSWSSINLVELRV